MNGCISCKLCREYFIKMTSCFHVTTKWPSRGQEEANLCKPFFERSESIKFNHGKTDLHSLKATTTSSQRRFIPADGYCSQRGSHGVCMKNNLLQFPPITRIRGTLGRRHSNKWCLKGHQCTQTGKKKRLWCKNGSRCLKTWKHESSWLCFCAVLCLLSMIFTAVDSCGCWKMLKGTFKLNSHQGEKTRNIESK